MIHSDKPRSRGFNIKCGRTGGRRATQCLNWIIFRGNLIIISRKMVAQHIFPHTLLYCIEIELPDSTDITKQRWILAIFFYMKCWSPPDIVGSLYSHYTRYQWTVITELYFCLLYNVLTGVGPQLPNQPDQFLGRNSSPGPSLSLRLTRSQHNRVHPGPTNQRHQENFKFHFVSS